MQRNCRLGCSIIRRLLFISAVVVILLDACSGQSPSLAVVEPEEIGTIFALDSATGALRPLPGEDWRHHNSTGWATTKVANVVPGEHSTYRLTYGEKIEFIYRPLKDDDMRVVHLYAFRISKGNRETIIYEHKGRNVQGNFYIPLTMTKYGTSSYKLTVTAPLEPGEYWVASPGRDQVHTFGIDALH